MYTKGKVQELRFEIAQTTEQYIKENFLVKKVINPVIDIYGNDNSPNPLIRDFFVKFANGTIASMDIKAYIPRDFYPDTSLNKSSIEKYIKIDPDIPFIILFYDYANGIIYGNRLEYMIPVGKEGNTKNGYRIFFPLNCLFRIRKIHSDHLQEVISLVNECRKLEGKQAFQNNFKYNPRKHLQPYQEASTNMVNQNYKCENGIWIPKLN